MCQFFLAILNKIEQVIRVCHLESLSVFRKYWYGSPAYSETFNQLFSTSLSGLDCSEASLHSLFGSLK